MNKLELKKIQKVYSNGMEAVKSICIKVKDKEFVSLVGPSGCGKSTTLRMIAGLEDISGGELLIDDVIVNDMLAKDRQIAMVFQSYALFPHMTVAQNIGFGLKLKKIQKKEIHKKIDEALELLDLVGLGDRKPSQLSGGQRQRVALGRALVLDPKILLLDEPLSNLDAKLRLKMRTELKRIHKKLKSTIIYVTHDQAEAMTLSDRIVIMNKGNIMQIGTPDEVYSQPKNLFVANFIGRVDINIIDVVFDGLNISINKKFIKVPKEYLEALSPYKGKMIKFAIRPEHIYLNTQAGDKYSEYKFDTTIDILEPLGDEVIAHFNYDDLYWEALINYDVELKEDAKISLKFGMDKAHFFDPETELIIK